MLIRPRTCGQHAIGRFIERWLDKALVDDGPTRHIAEGILLRLCANATHVEDCPNDLDGDGQSIWDLGGLDVPVRVAVTRVGTIRTVFKRGAHLWGHARYRSNPEVVNE